MLKQLSNKTNFILIGIVIGLFVGVSIRQASGQAGTATCDNAVCVPAGDAAQWRAGNLILNTSGQYANGLLVPYGNIGIGTITPNAKLEVLGNTLLGGKVMIGASNPAAATQALTVQGNIQSQGFCIGTTCVTNWDDLKTILALGSSGGGSTSSSGGSTSSGSGSTSSSGSGSTSSSGGSTSSGSGSTSSGSSSGGSSSMYCSVFYTGSSNDCMKGGNAAEIKSTCCGSGTMTACAAMPGGVEVTGTNCSYNPPAVRRGQVSAPIDKGMQWISYYETLLGGNHKEIPAGTSCNIGSIPEYNNYVTDYEQRNDGSGGPQWYTTNPPVSASCLADGGMCYHGHLFTQLCQ